MPRLTAILTLVLLGALVACRGEKEKEADLAFPNAPVIIVSVDTLRADHLPAYGYKGVATPNIDELRKDGILFSAAYSHVPLTLPSHVSILTGKLPPDHKVRNNVGYRLNVDPAATLPGVLKANGYSTAAAVSAYVLRSSTGLGAMFDFYDDAIASKAGVAVGSLQRPGSAAVASAIQWIDKQGQHPFFFMLHLFEPHSPYTPPERFSGVANAYDGEIAAADAYVGEMISFLKRKGLYENSIIIFLSDHGEGLNDHGEPEHGIFVYREAIHVPLIVKLPRRIRAGETIADPVGLIDVFPTVLQLTGTPYSPPLPRARSLLTAANGVKRRIYSESLYGRIHLGWSELRSLIDAEQHFIQAPRPELYDIRSDPAEQRNVLSTERRAYADMKKELDAYGSAIEVPSHIDPEEAAKLVALGYLGSAAPAAEGSLPDPKDRIGEIAEMMAAMRLSTERRNDEAIAAFRAIVKKNPRLADAWNQLALTLETTGRFEEAAEAYKKAIELTPALAGEFGLSLGSILLRLEKLDEAEAHARLGEAVNPAGSHILLGRVAMARKDLSRAEREIKEAMRDQSSRVAASILMAQIYAQQGRLAEAFSLIQQTAADAQQRDLGPVESLDFVRGDVLARMDRVDEAVVAFRQAIRDYPAHRQTYANLAVIYMIQGQPAEAHRLMEQMVEASPNRRSYLFAAQTLEGLEDKQGAALWRKRAQSVR